jgi:hypothetical protein
MAVARLAGYDPLMVTVGAMAADASEEGPSPWDALWMGEGFPPAPKAPANSPKAREENADLKACGCGWAKEIKYRAPSEIPVPDSVVAEWRKLPLTDERVINAWKAAYQRREWKAYLRGLSPCARAGRGGNGERDVAPPGFIPLWENSIMEDGRNVEVPVFPVTSRRCFGAGRPSQSGQEGARRTAPS